MLQEASERGITGMFFLRQTGSGIYYIYDYYPMKYRRITSEQDILRKQIWAYKDHDDDAMAKFTHELVTAITQISRNIRLSKVGLVAVPPSKTDKESPIRESIRQIVSLSKKGIIASAFGCNKTLYDYGNLLTRITDIRTSHKEGRATYEEQIESISCSRDRLWRYQTAFIILDDVTTLGTSMDACRDILIENGSNADKIYRLAIAKTV